MDSGSKRIRGVNSPLIVVQPCEYTVTHKDSQSPPDWEGGFDAVKTSKMKYFEDIYEHYGEGRWHFKPCTSVNMEYESNFVALKSVRTICAGSNDYVYTGGFHGQYPINGAFSTLFVVNPITGSFNKAALEGRIPEEMWRRLSGRFQSELPSLGKGAPDFYVFFSEFRDIFATFDFLGMKSLLDKAAAGLLTLEFGIKPLLGDLGKMFNLFTDAQDRIEDLERGVGKVHTTQAHISQEIDSDVALTNCCNEGNNPSCGEDTWSYMFRTVATVGVTAKYRYTMPEYMIEFLGDLMPFLRAMNMVPNLQNSWELIPFSFVVEWVFQASKIFDKWSNFMNPHDVQVEIIDLCVTEKVYHEEWIDSNCHCFVPSGHLFQTKVTLFDRTVGTDALNARIPWLKWPSNMQIALGAALARVTGIFG